jgi:hypothetical protein
MAPAIIISSLMITARTSFLPAYRVPVKDSSFANLSITPPKPYQELDVISLIYSQPQNE